VITLSKSAAINVLSKSECEKRNEEKDATEIWCAAFLLPRRYQASQGYSLTCRLLVVLSRLFEQIRRVISRSAPLKIAPHLACAFLACALQFASAASDDAFWSVGCNDANGYGQLRVQWQKSVGLDREG
jgi:hypothetical protein